MAKVNVKLVDLVLEDSRASAFMVLMQTVDAINKYADIRFHRVGLSQIKLVVLKVLEIHSGTMKPTDIARWTFREKHDITTLIRRLERDGLVSITRSSTDRRSVNVTLTEKGKLTLSQVKPLARDITDKIMSNITDETVAELGKIMQILRQNTLSGLEELSNRA